MCGWGPGEKGKADTRGLDSPACAVAPGHRTLLQPPKPRTPPPPPPHTHTHTRPSYLTGNNYSSMRCTVYARTFMDVGPGQVKLVRVAKFPVAPGAGDRAGAAKYRRLLV